MSAAAPQHIHDDDELEWEEWDGKGKFWHHCVAGSMAGVAEHTLLYPVDTVKTHIQACASCPHQTPSNPSSAVQTGTAGTFQSTQMYNKKTPRSGVATTTTMSNAKAVATSKVATPSTTSATGATSATVNRTLPPNSSMISTMRHIVTAQQPMELASATAAAPAGSSSSASATTRTTAAAAAEQSINPTNYIRLWRGVQTMILGCIPAHAFYFSSYEMTKAYFSTTDPTTGALHLSHVGGMAAGAAATFGHDCVMAPLDTIKQRLQLGHYQGLYHAGYQIYQKEGTAALYRSFPITLLTNIPYGMIMVSTNEFLKEYLMSRTNQQQSRDQKLPLSTCLQASSMAGMVAAALTTPLDRIKTSLQTQRLQPTCELGTCPNICPKLQPLNLYQIISDIWKQEGYQGFYRGLVPRIVTHTPAVAISWTTYETAKQWLTREY